jgi:hypothetical protein
MKFYKPAERQFFGQKYSGSPYFIQIGTLGHFRYVFEDETTDWSSSVDKHHAKWIKDGSWEEINELPPKPWKY